MPVKRQGRYLEFADIGIVPSLGIETSQLDDCIAEIRRRGIKGVFGCPVFGFKQTDLDFLEKVPFVVQVWFWQITLADIDGLYALRDLKYFGVHDKRGPIDFSQFPRLEHIVWKPIKGDKGMDSLNAVTSLDLWRFKGADKTFASLRVPSSLERLEINWSNPCDLRHFPLLPKLKHIQFHYCRNLVSLDGIVESMPNLEEIVITRCPNLADYNMLSALTLKRVYINIRNKEVANKGLVRTGDPRTARQSAQP